MTAAARRRADVSPTQGPRPRRGRGRSSVLVAAAATGVLVTMGGAARASDAVRGEVVAHPVPAAEAERCVMLARFPGGVYRPEGERQERALCAIDFRDGTHALCPKLFSTSPGVLVYDLADGPFAGRARDFEREICPQGRLATREAPRGAVSFKMSVNTRESSATFANASFVYYHFARYFDAAVHVPPAVLRTLDRQTHLQRVARVGESVSASRPPLKMLHAGWTAVVRAAQDPATYVPTDELLTSNRRQFYGVLLKPRGRRYGEEVNGSRQSGWGDGQSRDFQQTAPFVALATDRPLLEAIRHGVASGHAGAATPAAGREVQMASWMRDLVDVTLLDHLLGQQDRIGNIDYVTEWVWAQGGQVRRRPATGEALRAPVEIAAFAPVRIKRTVLGDNDAGLRTSYANYTQRTDMLKHLRHHVPETYRRLQALARDFDARGPLFEHVRHSYGLSRAEFDRVAANVADAARILRDSCHAGRLRFDIDPDALVLGRPPADARPDCDGG